MHARVVRMRRYWGRSGDVSNRARVHRSGAVARFLHIDGVSLEFANHHPSTGAIKMKQVPNRPGRACWPSPPCPAWRRLPRRARAEPDYTLTGNVGIFSDYRFRGISQTNKKPAIQGGIDFAIRTASTWATGTPTSTAPSTPARTSRWTSTAVGRPRSKRLRPRPRRASTTTTRGRATQPGSFKVDNAELYIGGSWGPLALKYSLRGHRLLRRPDTRGAYYFALSGMHDFGNGFGVNARRLPGRAEERRLA